MKKLRTLSLALALLLAGYTAQASSVPAFNAITSGDFDNIVNELSANFNYSTISPASSLGKVWGLEFGMIGGITKTPDILSIVKRNDATTSLKENFPHASILAKIGIPWGITLEGLFLPKLTISDVKLQQYGGAVMWSLKDEMFPELPFELAVKGYLLKTTVDWTQTVSSVTSQVSFDDLIFGAQALASYKILVFEPYVGFGYAKAKGNISVTGSTTFFSGTYAINNSATSKPSSLVGLGGLDVRLAFFSLGAEYQRSFDRNSYTGRLSFRF